MLRRLLSSTLRFNTETQSVTFLAASQSDELFFPYNPCFVLVPQRWKKGPGKRSKYALRRSEEIEGYRTSPFGVGTKRVKHFNDLKFYHAKNKYGQNQTLVDSRRRDIAFFDPIKGGYDRDPRARYEDSDSDENLDAEESSLFADFTDTDDEDIYFGGGEDADGDYDDEGKELRPRSKKNKKTWADDDPPMAIDNDETDLDEEEREFNEVFGKGRMTKTKKKPANTTNDSDDEFTMKTKARFSTDDLPSKEARNFVRQGGVAFDKQSKTTRAKRNSSGAVDFTEPDPELGIDVESYKARFEKKEQTTNVDAADFSAAEFLKEERELSSEGDGESDWDEEKLVRAGDEELEELTDVSNMFREYDRSKLITDMTPVTQEIADDEKQRQMDGGEFYESDDVEIPHTEDPAMREEIDGEVEENVRKLRSTPGGRKMLKKLDDQYGLPDEFPPCGKQHYENALRDAPYDGSVPNNEQSHRTKPPHHRRGRDERSDVYYARKDEAIAAMSRSKASDSFRTMATDKTAVKSETELHFSDLRRDEKRQKLERQRNEDKEKFRLRGRSPYGGSGVRFYSTSRDVEREDGEFRTWCEKSIELTYAARYARERRVREKQAKDRAASLRRYWLRFPPDETIEEKVTVVRDQFKGDGTIYVTMASNKDLLFGICAPKRTIHGKTNVADQFSLTPKNGFVKVHYKRFVRMKQRGEILTGGPHVNDAVAQGASHDWTGSVW